MTVSAAPSMNFDIGRVSQNWPFPLVDYWTATVTPNPADFLLGTKVTEPAE